ncbi:MAG: DUF4173 domain-containing protein [Bacillota bacterium]|nr:DUF4173 domain-containing protein [Bacillota bacterium]
MEVDIRWEDSYKEQVPIKKENIILLLCCMALGVIADILFYKKPFGISYPIFILIFYGVFIWRSRKLLKLKPDFGWLLTVPILALSSTYLIFSNDVFRGLNFFAIPILIIAQTLILSGSNSNKWFVALFISDIFYGMFLRTFKFIGKPFSIISKLLRLNSQTQRNKNFTKVLVGLAISFPLICIVAPLLASADKVFEHYLNSIPDIFKTFNFIEIIAQVIFISLIFLISFSYFWSLLNDREQQQNAYFRKEKAEIKFLDPVIVSTILICINIIYVLFVVIQFTYLLGGVKPLDFSFSEYARRGFFELIAVSLINFSILLININFTKQTSKLLNTLTRVLNSFLVICTLIMLYSAHYRMWLYEDAYGYTYLRVFTHSFMVFIFILLCATVIKVWYEKLVLLKYYIIIGILAYMVINFINVDTIIAAKNIERYNNHKPLDVVYFQEISYDAVPYLEKFVNDEKYGAQVRTLFYNKYQALKKKTSWQSFNISENRAMNVLSKYKLNDAGIRQSDLKNYRNS